MKYAILLLATFLTATLLQAGEPDKKDEKAEKKEGPPAIWRPFKELPDVLFYESFEHTVNAFAGGKLADPPGPPTGHAWKLETNTEDSYVNFQINKTQLKLMNGVNPTQIYIQASVYCDEPGTVNFKVIHEKGDYERNTPVPKPKMWNVITMKMSDLKNKENHAESEHTVKELQIHVRPMKNKKFDKEKTWIGVDDVIVTQNVKPEDVRPRLALAEKRKSDMEKMLVRDGYAYSMGINEYLKANLKAAKSRTKSKQVLVIAPDAEQTAAWQKAMAAAAPKVKESSYAFQPAEDPVEGTGAIGGLADMRTLLPYNLQKDPEMALLVVDPEEALGTGRPSDSLRVVIERTLADGVVPVVCVLASAKADVAKADDKTRNKADRDKDAEKVTGFVKAVEGICAQFGAPMIDAGFLGRNAKGEIDPVKLAAVTVDSSALLAMNAIKHVHNSLAAKD